VFLREEACLTAVLLSEKKQTGYGLIFFVKEMNENKNYNLNGAKVVDFRFRQRCHLRTPKATAYGARVVAMSDPTAMYMIQTGLTWMLSKIKEVERKRISEYVARRPGAKYIEGCKRIWEVPCDVALPCATRTSLIWRMQKH
jgi:glutamate dehydrogenase (NADP+)